MSKSVCVYCSASNTIDMKHFESAVRVGNEIARRGYSLVYGAGEVGLMGAVASAVQKGGGKIIGVVPDALNREGMVFQDADELIVTRHMRDRKAQMEAHADVFVTLPGGFGTLDEVIEIITLKSLGYHNKPIVFLNTHHFFEPLIALFEYLCQERFAKQSVRHLYYFAKTVEEMFEYIEHYRPLPINGKVGSSI